MPQIIAAPSLFYDRHGGWWFNNEAISHRKTCELLTKSLDFDATTQQYIVKIGHERAVVQIEDVAFKVQAVEYLKDLSTLQVTLSNQKEERINHPRFKQNTENELYILVYANTCWAKFSRNAFQSMEPHVTYQEGSFGFLLGTHFIALRPLNESLAE